MSEENETSDSPEQEAPAKSLIQTEASEEQETPKEEQPEEEAAPEEEFVPLTADDITIAEDLQVSDEIRDEFLGILNNRELGPKEKAQALLDLQQRVATTAGETLSREFEDQQKTWQDEVKADPHLGGGNFQTHLSKMGKLVEQFGSNELVEVFAATGAGNNIHVHRFLSKIAEVVLEGAPAQGSPTNASEDRASRMFPSMKG